MITAEAAAQAITWRCPLHRNRELSFSEHETPAFIEERLAEAGERPGLETVCVMREDAA